MVGIISSITFMNSLNFASNVPSIWKVEGACTVCDKLGKVYIHSLRQTKTFVDTECSNPCSHFDACSYCNAGTVFGCPKPLQCMLQRVSSHSSSTISHLMSNFCLCMHPLVVSNMEFAFYCSC